MKPAKHLLTGKQPRYPWELWFHAARRRPMVLIRGVHYLCQPHSMNVQVRTAALRRGLKATVHIDEGRLTVEVV